MTADDVGWALLALWLLAALCGAWIAISAAFGMWRVQHRIRESGEGLDAEG